MAGYRRRWLVVADSRVHGLSLLSRSTGGLPQVRKVLARRLFGPGRIRVRFNGDVDLNSRLQRHRLAVFILQSVLNPNLPVQVVCALNPNLCLFGFAGGGPEAE